MRNHVSDLVCFLFLESSSIVLHLPLVLYLPFDHTLSTEAVASKRCPRLARHIRRASQLMGHLRCCIMRASDTPLKKGAGASRRLPAAAPAFSARQSRWRSTRTRLSRRARSISWRPSPASMARTFTGCRATARQSRCTRTPGRCPLCTSMGTLVWCQCGRGSPWPGEW